MFGAMQHWRIQANLGSENAKRSPAQYKPPDKKREYTPVIAETFIDYQPKGAARALFLSKAEELVISGPAGTGKSYAALHKVHFCAQKYAGMRALIARKTLTSLTGSGLVTYREKVLHRLDKVHFFGGNKEESAQFRYPNGSALVVGGLDKESKVLSAEYDLIFIQQAEDLTEGEWETLTTRLRNGVMPYQQIIGDCNPDAPGHWLKRRADSGQLVMLESRHEDNPALWDGDWTDEGRRYIAKLNRLTGVRKDRLRHGRWVAAEGVVYEEFDTAVHLIDPFEIPSTWRRIRSIDFGFTNPFVCQWWAIDGDGRMFLYRELHHTQKLVSEMADQINELTGRERIEATVADHDAEDRATLHAKGIHTVPAMKAVSLGIQAVQDRLRPAGNGKPRLFLFRDALVQRDEALADAGKPVCTEQEFDSYVWPKSQDGKPIKEEPLKIDDHGMDTARYAVAYVDGLGQNHITGNRTAISGPRPILTDYKPR